MDDNTIIDLYFERSEKAVKESEIKYGGICHRIAENILSNRADSDECVNDTWMSAWGAMPPERPDCLGAFFARITRNISISRWRKNSAQKRKGDEAAICLDELNECLSDCNGNRFPENYEIRDALNRFLGTLNEKARIIFMQRYWYVCTIRQIADEHSIKEGAVKMSLMRTRNRLKEFLDEEGFDI